MARPQGEGADAREVQVAVHLRNGDNPSAACRKAGYPEAVVRCRAAKIARRPAVLQVLAELGAGLPVGSLGNAAKQRIKEKLEKPPKDERTALGYYRTALEIDGAIGGPDLHLHDHTISPAAAQMIAEKVLELQRKEESIDGAIVSEGAASEGQDAQDHEGIQDREPAFGFQDRAAG